MLVTLEITDWADPDNVHWWYCVADRDQTVSVGIPHDDRPQDAGALLQVREMVP